MMKNAQDKDFKARSQKASKNRRGGDLTSSVPPSHVQGSISSAERAKRLAAQRGGMLPSAVDLFMDTHMRDESGKKVPINDKVQKIKESYDKTLAQCEERGETKAPNQIFFETVGGRKKGWVPGLGTSADLYFERSSRGGGSSSSSCTPSMYSQLSAKFEEERAEMQRERERMQKVIEEERIARQKEREEDRRVYDEYLTQMRATMETYSQMMSQCGGSFPPPGPRDPPTGGGDACAT
ncbi:uncharacterized protein LOC130590331 [Beta vulgaris subsp. vulgaris]|uniref:uncharacterized protein LOC130590331 n=1 Tax=Beta vulgaris subsp. vulgaris TaxID=3555 RepID=UPI002546E6A5|nr:uncharacterized protein LOC130590331 [Beta vulgaris subsp. vulgaris]